MLRAVLFDFDGTLADSFDAIASSTNHVRARQGLSPLSVAEVKCHVGHGLSYLMEHTVGVGEQSDNERLYREHHPEVMTGLTRLLPGAEEALLALGRSRKQLAVCSNKPPDFTRSLLDSLGIGSLFSVVVGPTDVPRPKPAPDMLQLAMARMGVRPDESLYVGDMTVDVQAARAAGVPVWIIPTGCEDRATVEAARPDRILASMADLASGELS